MKHDVVIRNGNIIDGTGSSAFEADIAIDGDSISAIGKVTDKGTEEIDAKGLAVTPGFVDLHTHTWTHRLAGTRTSRPSPGTV